MSTLRSMTSFARTSYTFKEGTLTIEMQSVNRRFLEVTLNLPALFSCLEPFLRKELSSYIGRGAVTFSVRFTPSTSKKITPNFAAIAALKDAWEEIATALHIEEKVSLSLLAREKELFTVTEEMTDPEVYKAALEAALQKALTPFIQMKEEEGKVLAVDLQLRMQTIEKGVAEIEILSSQTVEQTRRKLQERLEKLLEKSMEEDERLIKEVALLAERADITEELTRLKSHLQQARGWLITPLVDLLETKGKKLDFLVQEMLRETNTIGSKASDQKIIHLVVEIKAELEKIKEQVQNIE